MPPRDDDSDVESDLEQEWLLGFVEPPRKRTDLLRHRFPSKVGGRPAWLDPIRLPAPEQLTCPSTHETMLFLMQIYAPLDANPAAFHRTIYVFLSPDGSALTAPGAVRALRCQLPRRNAFYSENPPRKEDVLPPPLPNDQLEASFAKDPWKSLAREVSAASAVAAKSKSTEDPSFPSSACTSLGFETSLSPSINGNSKTENRAVEPSSAAATAVAGDMPSPTPSAPASASVTKGAMRGRFCNASVKTFPELEVVVEPEPEDDDEASMDARTQALLRQYRAREEAEGAYTAEELPNDVVDGIEEGVGPEQQHFAAFAARVAREPAQVLRYCFEEGASPLCPSSIGIPGPADIPRCSRCGGPRQFEFQIMPQLINHLGTDAADPKAPDWGAIAVYSCAASCGSNGGGRGSSEGSEYVEEWAWVQRSA